ncbi:MAG: AI-2E family transporter [Comamonas sp. SCN 67-35]|uniref:AI-2E family transporter n=1 Tax=unclassified Comamonas TaxID=2638500 RepID=UPI00086D9FDA|nr:MULTISPECIES: AI-2E family transporter [unclassified Comamonas]MBN9331456.1 AI-2E family transporter [Comamonas sp.]ODU37356.1 MAG: AI-2E family transporter [Comamonas sp. SCN 67-35]OJX01025.1 MAG: AI-2E family transporter [Burkholderiales bacterium 66-26]
MHQPTTRNRALLLLLATVTLAFGAILLPLHGAIFWGMVLAILFAPLHRRLLLRMRRKPNLAALLTLTLCLLIVILPMFAIGASVVQEAGAAYQRVRSGQLDFGAYAQQIWAALPAWVLKLLESLHLGTFAELQAKLASFGTQASQFLANQAVNVGSNTLQFIVNFGVMLYLLFFLLRDGPQLGARIRNAIPLDEEHKQELAAKFITVIRATVKGNIAVAATQGALGGLIFWVLGIQGPVLWGVIMAFLSLLPAVGASLIWGPVTLYFLATGATWQGITLALYGVGVIGLVDNLLRPLLVGKDTKMPDYVVLISTLGGMALFGLTGFVIGPVVAALFMATWDLYSPPAAADASTRK